jgi:hypothetical protein
MENHSNGSNEVMYGMEVANGVLVKLEANSTYTSSVNLEFVPKSQIIEKNGELIITATSEL